MRLALALPLLLLATPVWADDDACAKFKWSVAHARALFAAPAPLAATGALTIGDKGYRVALADDLALPVPPERAPKAGTHEARLTIAVAKSGVYQITLSDEGWIDVAQNGALVKSSAFSGQKGCPGVRKSVRFPLTAGEAVAQISNVDATTLDVAVEAGE